MNCCCCLETRKTRPDLESIEAQNTKAQLKHLVPEVHWESTWLVCNLCLDLLKQFSRFQKVCLDSNTKRNSLPKFQCELSPFSIKSEPDSSDECKYSVIVHNLDFKCNICDNAFKTSRQLVLHCVSDHNINSKEVRPYNCDQCDKKFQTSSHLLQHKSYHDGDRSHICTYCGKGFIRSNDLIVHEKRHLNKREYICTICNKSFNTHKNLGTHRLVVHSDPSTWKHVCSYCNKRFAMKSNLEQHERRHAGDKRFACHLCKKRFVDKVVLQKHLVSHTNVRPYKCVECSKEYKEKRSLEIHLTRVHKIGDFKVPIREKKFTCHICPNAYPDITKLKRHLNFHSGEKPFVCKVCSKGFRDRSYVSKHLRLSHNINVSDETKQVK